MYAWRLDREDSLTDKSPLIFRILDSGDTSHHSSPLQLLKSLRASYKLGPSHQTMGKGSGDDAVDEENLILCCALCCCNASVYNGKMIHVNCGKS